MIKTVDFIFDFGSPNAYLVHKVLPKIAERRGARFNYIPCLLGGIFKSTGNQSPLQAYAKIPPKWPTSAWKCSGLSPSTSCPVLASTHTSP
jgi:2-hydroxychromene-2-carboxylate isomerase